MKKSKALLFCLTLVMCTLVFGGCSRNNDENGTNETTSTVGADRETERNTQRETNTNNDRETQSSEGVVDELGDDMETMLDPTR